MTAAAVHPPDPADLLHPHSFGEWHPDCRACLLAAPRWTEDTGLLKAEPGTLIPEGDPAHPLSPAIKPADRSHPPVGR